MAWVVLSLPLFSTAQSNVGAYPPKALKETVPTAPATLQEQNVKYSKRVIREIDPRQKVNKGLTWPQNHFSNVLFMAVTDSQVTAYKNNLFTDYYDYEFVADSLHIKCEWIDVEDSLYPGTYYTIEICYNVMADLFYEKFWVMEDWVFDYERGVLEPRIIAIAPIHYPEIAGVSLGAQPLYWVKMEDLRPVIAKEEMFTTDNKAARLSFDDFFQMRLFDSYVVKESNVFDYKIRDFDEFKDDGVAALLKSEEIDNDFFLFEHDFWQY